MCGVSGAWLEREGAWLEREHVPAGVDFGSGFGERLHWQVESVAALRAGVVR